MSEIFYNGLQRINLFEDMVRLNQIARGSRHLRFSPGAARANSDSAEEVYMLVEQAANKELAK